MFPIINFKYFKYLVLLKIVISWCTQVLIWDNLLIYSLFPQKVFSKFVVVLPSFMLSVKLNRASFFVDSFLSCLAALLMLSTELPAQPWEQQVLVH